MAETKRNKSLFNRISFYIVGNRTLENELIAFYLENELGNECFVLEDIHHIPKKNPKREGSAKLIFCDCQERDFKRLLRELKAYNTQSVSSDQILLFNVPSDLAPIRELITGGIRGLFYEQDSLDIFIKGVRTVLNGKLWFSREVMTKLLFEDSKGNNPEAVRNRLTERQIEILALIAVGATNTEISDKLCISPHTVKTHLYKIFKEINVPNRVQAALWAAGNLCISFILWYF